MHRQGHHGSAQASPRRPSAAPSPSKPARHSADYARPPLAGTATVPEETNAAAAAVGSVGLHGPPSALLTGSTLSRAALASMDKRHSAAANDASDSDRLTIPVPARNWSSSNMSDAAADHDEEVRPMPSAATGLLCRNVAPNSPTHVGTGSHAEHPAGPRRQLLRRAKLGNAVPLPPPLPLLDVLLAAARFLLQVQRRSPCRVLRGGVSSLCSVRRDSDLLRRPADYKHIIAASCLAGGGV